MASSILSLLALRAERPDLLLPSHGAPIHDAIDAIDRTIAELRRLLEFRGSYLDFDDWLARPYVSLTPHLLHNRTSHSFSYVLVSESGKALLLDFGYDFITGLPNGNDRSSRRPWLYTLDTLKRDFGVRSIDVAIPTHYHDDHVAGFNLLRDVEGTQVWVPDNFADVLERPMRYDLPCLWYDPIPVDRRLAFGRPIRWHEYELTVHELPGHTLFAAAIELEVDGLKVLATGDQQDGQWVAGERPEFLNYQYRNGFRFDDFTRSAQLYRRLAPDLMISGHWLPRPVTDDYLDALHVAGTELARVPRDLLPLETADFGAGGFGALIEPYRSVVGPGTEVLLEVVARNPFRRAADTCVRLALPDGWSAEPAERVVRLRSHGERRLSVRVRTGPDPVRRARIGADLTVGDVRFGQQAEALVTVR